MILTGMGEGVDEGKSQEPSKKKKVKSKKWIRMKFRGGRRVWVCSINCINLYVI
jgi:hypothetical protein